MPIDKEMLAQAVDAFDNDNFVDAQEILVDQLARMKNEYLKDKLGLEKDVIPIEEPNKEDDENNEEE